MIVLPKSLIKDEVYFNMRYSISLFILLLSKSDSSMTVNDCSYSELKDELKVSYSTISRWMTELIKLNVIEVQHRPNRSNVIKFTDKILQFYYADGLLEFDQSNKSGFGKSDKAKSHKPLNNNEVQNGLVKFDKPYTVCSVNINKQQLTTNIVPSLADLTISDTVKIKLTEQFTQDQIDQAVKVYHEYSRKAEVKNPVAFLKRAVAEGWIDEKTKDDLELQKKSKLEAERESRIEVNSSWLMKIEDPGIVLDGLCVNLLNPIRKSSGMVRLDENPELFRSKILKFINREKYSVS
jgi:hypothetical protein